MKLDIYQVDAFTSKLFSGNPAAVIPLKKWLENDIMQKIAMENNLSETAFFVKEKDCFHIRWFTPQNEVPLCGHATLASAYVIFNFIENSVNKIKFSSLSGNLFVERNGNLLSLNFPSNVPHQTQRPKEIFECFNKEPIEILSNGFFLLVVFDSEDFIKNYIPKIDLIKKIHPHAVIITAKGKQADFVSRVFVPNEGIDEDPVTGSAHTVLVPYWSEKLKKTKLIAKQVSKRGGQLVLENLNERVKISGEAILFLKGEIYLNL
ncbi:PhzF family phenazine biosynthesis protein [Melioribacteraceae bacterium 4301-Me]|uniref:PhzF family phenazine biosynthesis protein n=1 Tax=Pyranulibacter aquaticus TaxID=3163344 RepID=UPI0035997F09